LSVVAAGSVANHHQVPLASCHGIQSSVPIVAPCTHVLHGVVPGEVVDVAIHDRSSSHASIAGCGIGFSLATIAIAAIAKIAQKTLLTPFIASSLPFLFWVGPPIYFFVNVLFEVSG
jgi:hypothetical protein